MDKDELISLYVAHIEELSDMCEELMSENNTLAQKLEDSEELLMKFVKVYVGG